MLLANDNFTIEHNVIINIYNVAANANKNSRKCWLKDTDYGSQSDTYKYI